MVLKRLLVLTAFVMKVLLNLLWICKLLAHTEIIENKATKSVANIRECRNPTLPPLGDIQLLQEERIHMKGTFAIIEIFVLIF